MIKYMSSKAQGFTLIELITVIIILGILAVSATSFLQFGARIFTESSDRDELISSARFAIERLNREIRHALPNSAVASGGCLTFTPILESTIYTEIPVAPEAASNKIKVVKFDKDFDPSWKVIVYPLTVEDLNPSNNKVFKVNSMDNLAGDEREITLDGSAVQFASDSPTNRLYFVKDTVSYCIVGSQLRRNGTLMADDLANGASEFVVKPATLQRNGYIQVTLAFDKNQEQVSFTNEIQVPNVP